MADEPHFAFERETKQVRAHLRFPTEEAIYRLRAIAELNEPMEPHEVTAAVALIASVLGNLAESVETLAGLLPLLAPGGGSVTDDKVEDHGPDRA